MHRCRCDHNVADRLVSHVQVRVGFAAVAALAALPALRHPAAPECLVHLATVALNRRPEVRRVDHMNLGRPQTDLFKIAEVLREQIRHPLLD